MGKTYATATKTNPFMAGPTPPQAFGLQYKPLPVWQSAAGGALSGISGLLIALGSGNPQQALAGFQGGIQGFDAGQARRQQLAQEAGMYGLQVDQYQEQKRQREEDKAAEAAKIEARNRAIDLMVQTGGLKPEIGQMMKDAGLEPSFSDLVPKAAGPESALGKLRADLDAGLITPEAFAAAVAKETRIPPEPQGPATWSDIKDAQGNIVGQRSSTGQVNYFSSYPGQAQPTFPGTGVDATAYNIVLEGTKSGNTSDPSYGAAYSQLAMPKVTFDPVTQKAVIVSPDMSWAAKPEQTAQSAIPTAPGARPGPTMEAAGAQPAPSAAPSVPPMTQTTVPGATILSTPGNPQVQKPDEQMAKNRQLYQVAVPDYQIVMKNFDDLSNLWNQAKGAVGADFAASPGYQRAKQALKSIIASYIYSTSGSQAPEPEVARQAGVLMPYPGEAVESVADKKARIKTMVESIATKGWPSGGAPGLEPPANQGGGPDERGLQPGDIEDGYRYKGGDKANPSSWEKVQ